METVEAYFERKTSELRLLNDCLRCPLPFTKPLSVAEVIQQKFRLTALLKAEHASGDWTGTETSWASSKHTSGRFEFAYDYQRADLDVRGPAFYELNDCDSQTVYAGSGMAAIAALLLASARLIGRAKILVPPGSYGETQELVQGYARQLHLVTDFHEAIGNRENCRILLLDSSLPAAAFEATVRERPPQLDLLIFDTTCFVARSGRIGRVVKWAKHHQVPLVMVRSHNKLDSLGAEYGRLGSAVFIDRHHDFEKSPSKIKGLPSEMRNAVRLLGGAALPAHFPPYVGRPTYRELTSRRTAAILRNSRRSSRYFAAKLPCMTRELRYTHGLYITLKGADTLSEEKARQTAALLSEDLGGRGLAIRHAGSFGFDFAATEWFRDRTTDEYVVRIAIPDLATVHWDELTHAIAEWWLAHMKAARLRRADLLA